MFLSSLAVVAAYTQVQERYAEIYSQFTTSKKAAISIQQPE